MPRVVICSHNIKSNALKDLAKKLGETLGYTVWRVTPDRIGRSVPVWFYRGIDKITQLRAFHAAGVSAPAFAIDLAGARSLTSREVVVRALTDSSEGRGITICNRETCNIEAPLYTEYIPKKKEYRVHVWGNQVIDIQEKRRRDGAEGSTQIRNTENGYVFCREDVVVPRGINELALQAVLAIGRSQGAVDIIWNEHRDQCYVLEVNSRPGMEGTTLEKYAEAIIGGLRG